MSNNSNLIHPPLEQRRKQNGKIRAWVQELNRARTLTDVGLALANLQDLVSTTAGAYGIQLNHLKGIASAKGVQTELVKQAGGNAKIVLSPMPGRARYNSVKKAILKYAGSHSSFTVDTLMEDSSLFKGISRRSIVANLHAMSTRGDKPLKQSESGKLGCKGLPATYSLNKIIRVL